MKQPRMPGAHATATTHHALPRQHRAAAAPDAERTTAAHAAAAPLGSPRLLAQRQVLQAVGPGEEELLQGASLEEEEPLQGAGFEDEEPLQGASLEEEEPLQGAGLDEEEPLQGAGMEEEELLQGRGLPPALAAGVQQLAGVSVADVRVHHGSPLPAQVGAAAYAQGTDIHLAPGQERHLPHEAWHVAQQRQGRVQPTTQVAGVPVNANPALEAEADRMGAQAQAAGESRRAAGR
jgi:hypothetical protein